MNLSGKICWPILAAVLLAVLSPEGTYAKSKSLKKNSTLPKQLTRSEIFSLEQRLTPFLESRYALRHRKGSSVKIPQIDEVDLMLLAKVWNQLSQEFKSLFKKTAAIPEDFDRYISPGGNFEIFYTTDGANQVDSTDEYCFAPDEWRQRVEAPNGIPDYVDETAFALDSTWEMEIERFGFVHPLVYKDETSSSDQYKIVIEKQGEAYYGLTYLHGQSSGDRGYTSSISLRNDWSGWEWSSLGYDRNPINGLRVTCAHEFFHAIQYSMSWNVSLDVFLDDFPLSWTEGTAVCMEEMAFDSINDYLQYAETYFYNPGMSFLSRSTSDIVYTNSILLIYLSRDAFSGGTPDFIHDMHFENYRSESRFHTNLYETAEGLGTSWIDLLHSFHTASFFTGHYADPVKFIPDAGLFTMRQTTPLEETDTTFSTVLPNGARHVWLNRSSDHGDTVFVNFSITTESNEPSRENDRCSVLLRSADKDSLVFLTVNSSGIGSGKIGSWKKWDKLTFIASNGDLFDQKNLSLLLQPYPVMYTKGTIFRDTLIDSAFNGIAAIELEAAENLHGPLVFVDVAVETEILEEFSPVSTSYSVQYPSFWHDNGSVTLSIIRPADPVSSPDSVYLCRRIDSTDTWEPVAVEYIGSADSLSITHTLDEPGVYALCLKSSDFNELLSKITVYPNPVSLRSHDGIVNIIGKEISEVFVYTITGTLIWHFTPEPLTSAQTNRFMRLRWKGRNSSGSTVSPGIYSMVVIQDGDSGGGPYRTRKKMIITP
jgi:hypothetical protein